MRSYYPVNIISTFQPREQRELRGKWTGEYRKPKKGEYYLSGAIVEVYRAPNDLSKRYHIAKIVRIREVTYIIEIEDA